jgi:hypothetical protein
VAINGGAVDVGKGDHACLKRLVWRGREKRAREVSLRAVPDRLNLGIAESARYVDGGCGIAVHLGWDRVDKPASAAVEATCDLREDVVLDEVVEIKDADVSVPLAGMLKLVAKESREQHAVIGLGRNGDAVELAVLVAIGHLALCVVAGKPSVVWLNVCVRPEPSGSYLALPDFAELEEATCSAARPASASA